MCEPRKAGNFFDGFSSVDECRIVGIRRPLQMTLSQIDKLKAEIAKLEAEALKELNAKREALVAQIASIDEQIAALAGTDVIGPSARKRIETKPGRSTSTQEFGIAVANGSANGHSIGQEKPDLRNDKALAKADPKLPKGISLEDQNNPPMLSADIPVLLPRIPVLGKSPHPIGFSYPLGAGAMSEALAGLPMFDRFSLRYSNRTPIFTMSPPLKGFPLLRITYTNYPVYEPRGSTHFQGGERWAIEILPTPFDHREFIQKVILEKAVPLLREWLTGPDLPTSDVRRMAKACWYVIESGLVKCIDDQPA
jgi:hypothetical protein